VGITASRMTQPMNQAPASMTIIDRGMIEASGAIEIVDLLRLVPGFQVSRSTINTPNLVAYHGLSDILQRGIEVMVDGASVYSSYLTVDWRTLGVALEDIERIEVLRGEGRCTDLWLQRFYLYREYYYPESGRDSRAVSGRLYRHSQ
jgi:iron complex outermembrane receptor protein